MTDWNRKHRSTSMISNMNPSTSWMSGHGDELKHEMRSSLQIQISPATALCLQWSTNDVSLCDQPRSSTIQFRARSFFIFLGKLLHHQHCGRPFPASAVFWVSGATCCCLCILRPVFISPFLLIDFDIFMFYISHYCTFYICWPHGGPDWPVLIIAVSGPFVYI